MIFVIYAAPYKTYKDTPSLATTTLFFHNYQTKKKGYFCSKLLTSVSSGPWGPT